MSKTFSTMHTDFHGPGGTRPEVGVPGHLRPRKRLLYARRRADSLRERKIAEIPVFKMYLVARLVEPHALSLRWVPINTENSNLHLIRSPRVNLLLKSWMACWNECFQHVCFTIVREAILFLQSLQMLSDFTAVLITSL